MVSLFFFTKWMNMKLLNETECIFWKSNFVISTGTSGIPNMKNQNQNILLECLTNIVWRIVSWHSDLIAPTHTCGECWHSGHSLLWEHSSFLSERVITHWFVCVFAHGLIMAMTCLLRQTQNGFSRLGG